MALGTPYFIGSTGDTTSLTQTITVSTATSTGDAILVATGSSATAATVTGIVDSASNVYTAAIAVVTSDEEGQVWIAAYGSGGSGTQTTALTTSNTITVTYGSTSGEKACVAVGVSGLSIGGGAVDGAATSNKGNSGTVSTTSGTLAFATEVALGVIFNAAASGSPSSVTGGWTPITSGQYQAGTSPYVTCYYQDTSATTALTLGATITSGVWSSMIIPLRGPVYLTSGFEQGATVGNGNPVAAATSGGGNDSAWNAVTNSTGNTTTYSNSLAHSGAFSMNVTEGSTIGADYVTWTTSLTGSPLNQIWFRLYIYCTGYPPSTLRIAEMLTAGSTNLCGGICILTSGKVECLDSAGVVVPTSTNAINANGWTRIEGYVIGSATAGSIQYQIFLSPDSATPTETETSATNLDTFGAMSVMRFGDPSSVASYTFNLDDLGASDTGYLGPSQLSGSATAAITMAATATGSSVRTGSPPAALTLTTTAAGSSQRSSSPSGALVLAATAAGTRQQAATRAAALTLAAAATGTSKRSGAPSASVTLAAHAVTPGAAKRAGLLLASFP